MYFCIFSLPLHPTSGHKSPRLINDLLLCSSRIRQTEIMSVITFVCRALNALYCSVYHKKKTTHSSRPSKLSIILLNCHIKAHMVRLLSEPIHPVHLTTITAAQPDVGKVDRSLLACLKQEKSLLLALGHEMKWLGEKKNKTNRRQNRPGEKTQLFNFYIYSNFHIIWHFVSSRPFCHRVTVLCFGE